MFFPLNIYFQLLFSSPRTQINFLLKIYSYSGVDVRVTPTRTEIIILATRTQSVLGEKGRRIRELTGVVQKRFNFAEGSVEVCVCVCVWVCVCVCE